MSTNDLYDKLTAEASNKLCGVCQGPANVAWLNRQYRLRCLCYLVDTKLYPQLYKPETPQEHVRRTGTGDTVAIMQVERQRKRRQRDG